MSNKTEQPTYRLAPKRQLGRVGKRLAKSLSVKHSPVSWNSRHGSRKVPECGWRLQHVKGDLFSCHEKEALAHCISEDCRMGAGIAVMFRKEFGGVDDLKRQKKVPGQCAVLSRGKRFVYYLITKHKASQKPTNESLKQSLEDMKSHCIQHGVTRISMPRIGCGLDRLKWEDVSEILQQVFQHTDIHITVYTLPEKPEAKRKQHPH